MDVRRRWSEDPALLPAARGLFTYGPGDDRATGYLYAQGEQRWPPDFAGQGSDLLDLLDKTLGVRFTIVLFQAYRNGTGCDWHTDDAFDVQAILSLGASRTFGLRRPGETPTWTTLDSGDLLYMPSGFQDEWQHCVPAEDVVGERVSLVFRTVRR